MEDETHRARSAKSGSPYLNAGQAAHYLGLSARSLQRMRAAGTGPTFRRHTRMIQYHIDDLRAWSDFRAAEKRS